MRFVLGLIFIAIVAVLIFIRLAPSDPARWHVSVEGSENMDFAGGALRVIPADGDALARADLIMKALPRTQVLAGTVVDGRVTYITRSRVFGFPDYTTIEYTDGTLKALARLRFGQSDLGVNRERLEGVIAALQ